MANHTIHLSFKAENKYLENFARNKMFYQQFSKWVSNKLENIDKEKFDLDELIRRKEKINLKDKELKKDLKYLKKKIKIAERERKKRFTFTEEATKYLLECKIAIKRDNGFFYPRLKQFNKFFSRDLTSGEFEQVLKKLEGSKK